MVRIRTKRIRPASIVAQGRLCFQQKSRAQRRRGRKETLRGVLYSLRPWRLCAQLLAFQRRAMKMDVPPASALALPDTRLLEAGGEGIAVRSDALVETDIGDNSHIAHDADMRRRHRRVLFAAKAA